MLPEQANLNVMHLPNMSCPDAFPAALCGLKTDDVVMSATCTPAMQMGEATSSSEPWVIVADRKSMFDEYLPRQVINVEPYTQLDLAKL
jgi:hypothetical protein